MAPSKIGLSTPRPADFDTFWDAKLAAQAKIPINPVLAPVATDVPDVELKMFELDALGSKAHGYVARPARDGRFPAVLQLQYAGVYALNAAAAAKRAAEGWLIVNLDAHDKLPSDPSGNVPRNYQAVGGTDRETSYFLTMYLRASRALDYLMTRPDWDGNTIVVIGGSMGGQQSLALAGLRPDKMSAVLVCVPAGADTNGDLHGRRAGYPNWLSTDPDVMHTALYFDTVNFASRIKAPVLAGMGFIDTISPPAGIFTMLNQIPGAVEALPMIESEHDNLTPAKGHACPVQPARCWTSSCTAEPFCRGRSGTDGPLACRRGRPPSRPLKDERPEIRWDLKVLPLCLRREARVPPPTRARPGSSRYASTVNQRAPQRWRPAASADPAARQMIGMGPDNMPPVRITHRSAPHERRRRVRSVQLDRRADPGFDHGCADGDAIERGLVVPHEREQGYGGGHPRGSEMDRQDADVLVPDRDCSRTDEDAGVGQHPAPEQAARGCAGGGDRPNRQHRRGARGRERRQRPRPNDIALCGLKTRIMLMNRSGRPRSAVSKPAESGPPAAAIQRASRASVPLVPVRAATLAMIAAAPAAPPTKK